MDFRILLLGFKLYFSGWLIISSILAVNPLRNGFHYFAIFQFFVWGHVQVCLPARRLLKFCQLHTCTQRMPVTNF